MTDSLKAELFRCRKDKLLLFAFIFVTAGFIFMTFIAGFAGHNDRVTIFTSGNISQFCSIVKMAVFVLYFVWFQEYRYGTMKNLCMSETTRGQYFTAKFLTQIIVCIALDSRFFEHTAEERSLRELLCSIIALCFDVHPAVVTAFFNGDTAIGQKAKRA